MPRALFSFTQLFPFLRGGYDSLSGFHAEEKQAPIQTAVKSVHIGNETSEVFPRRCGFELGLKEVYDNGDLCSSDPDKCAS
jgi:hypothetical protein